MTETEIIPRGVRNNNPFNIRHSKDKWQGQAADQPDIDFITFLNPKFGIRAGMKILFSYQMKYDLRTVRDIINRFAPPSENDTEAYMNSVSSHLGITPDTVFNISDKPMMIKLCQAIIIHENGRPENYKNYINKNCPYWYPSFVFEDAWALAGKN